MIQDHIRDILADNVSDFNWTVNYYTERDNTATVYEESGKPPDLYDTEYRYPSYMVYVRSSNWEKSRYIAEKVYEQLHKKTIGKVTVEYEIDDHTTESKTFEVLFLWAVTDPIRIGVRDGVMEYSINFDSILREE